MSMVAAAQAVFNTAELLEAIILELPPLDILVYQRVSKNWRNGVQKSVVVQRALFLAPEDTKDLELEADGVTLKDEHKWGPSYVSPAMPPTNPFLWTRAFGKLLRSPSSSIPTITPPPSSVIANPMLKPLFDLLNGKWRRGINISTSWKRPEASWQDMFLTQPPTGASSYWSTRGITQGKDLAKVVMKEESRVDFGGLRILSFEYTGRLVFPPMQPPPVSLKTLPEKSPNQLQPSNDEYVWDTEKQQWSRDGELL